MTRLLVTGATGLIGQAALPLLIERDYEVHGVTSGRSPIPPVVAVKWHKVDLLDQGQTGDLLRNVRPKQLLHLAWTAAPGEWLASPLNVRWVEASLQLLREFAALGGARAVISGSCAEYDLFHGFCSEDITPLRPRNLYGVCKHALQSVASVASVELGLRLAWARIFSVYGPGEHPLRLVPSVIRSLLRAETASCAYGGHIRDYLHSIDVASALIHLLETDVEGPVNVGSGIPLSLRELVLTIGEHLGRPDLIEAEELTTATGQPPLIVADVRRLRETAGWLPSLTLDAGLEQTISWWREHD